MTHLSRKFRGDPHLPPPRASVASLALCEGRGLRSLQRVPAGLTFAQSGWQGLICLQHETELGMFSQGSVSLKSKKGKRAGKISGMD